MTFPQFDNPCFVRSDRTRLKQIVINLEQSKVVNSIGMSFLLEIIEKLQDVQGRLVFTNMDPAVEKMLTIMGLFEFAGKAPNVDEALKSFS